MRGVKIKHKLEPGFSKLCKAHLMIIMTWLIAGRKGSQGNKGEELLYKGEGPGKKGKRGGV